MTKPLLKISGLKKSFPYIENNRDRMRGMWATLRGRVNDGGHVVLNGIDFTINRGESLAIVGKNGAGKSTLLKIISGVLQPTEGVVQVNGSIGALLELGSGFDPEYTGYENLKMAAALAGIKDNLIDKLNRMVQFADIGDYLHEPVKTYSSGMVVRLGFSVITETRPDLLITDEILAVGDEAFQIKCLAWVDNYLKTGGTLLLVSHSMYHIQTICKHALWLEKGTVKLQGDAHKVSKAYQHEILGQLEKLQYHQDVNTYHVAGVQILVAGEVVTDNKIKMGQSFDISVKIFTPDGLKPGLSMGIAEYDDRGIYGTYSSEYQCQPQWLDDHHVVFNIKVLKNPLLPGEYRLKLHTMTPDQLQMVDTFLIELRVEGKTREMGYCRIETEWS